MSTAQIRRKIRRAWVRRLILAFFGTIVWLNSLGTLPGQTYDFAVHDWLVRLSGPSKPPDDIVIVALDEQTYRTWDLPMDRPLPRERHAQLIKRLAELGAQRVVFDVVFEGRSSNEEWDKDLAASLQSMPVILGVDYGLNREAGMQISEIIKPDPFLADHVAALAIVTLRTEDGVARLFFHTTDETASKYVTLSEAATGILTPGDRKSRELPNDFDLINFYGHGKTIPTLSMSQVLEKEVPIPSRFIKDKIVFVGQSMRTGLGAMYKDSFQTPFGDVFGVEIHATQAANMIERSWLRRCSLTEEKWIGGVLCFLLALLVVSLRPLWGLLFVVAQATLWSILAFGALRLQLFMPGAAVVTAIVPPLYLLNTLYWYHRTRKRQKEIEGAFACYLSPAMVSELKRNPALLKLGGEELVCSAIFTDIKGFTSISESLGPMGVVSMLNAYFSEVSDAITDEGGTVIKFIGDAVFALWNAPLPQTDHAERAVRAALRIQEVVDRFNQRGEFPKLVTRVGVNTGKMVVGNLGSGKRFDYTAIGDSVNLAARVEGVNKYLGSVVLVTEESLNNLGAHSFLFLRMGSIRVVGKEIPVSLFRLLQDSYPQSIREKWEIALSLFASRNWDAASSAFDEIGKVADDLKVACETYLEAVTIFRISPPGNGWQGELVMDHK